jgi:hypothetical protein
MRTNQRYASFVLTGFRELELPLFGLPGTRVNRVLCSRLSGGGNGGVCFARADGDHLCYPDDPVAYMWTVKV